MKTTESSRSAPRAARNETPAYRYAVGQDVRLKNDFLQRSQKVDVYRIVATLPPMGDSPQYRIRNDSEPHDRVATQDRLEPLGTTIVDTKARLTEELFGRV